MCYDTAFYNDLSCKNLTGRSRLPHVPIRYSLKKSFTITKITRRISQTTFQMHIQYLHTFTGSPISTSVSPDCMQGMLDINVTLCPYSVLFIRRLLTTQKGSSINVGFSKSNGSKITWIPVKNVTLFKQHWRG